MLLLFVAVPIKYFNGDDRYVKLLGMPHGLFFMLYIILAIVIQKQMKWNAKNLGIVMLASIIPFGTFYIDKRYLR